jgi:Icc-related predicted phosphoesterase
MTDNMKLLTVSDREIPQIYSPKIKEQFGDVSMAISCGDLSYYYLEYIISALDIPLYFVRGNHANDIEYGCAGPRKAPWGAVDLHQRVIRDSKTGILMAGIEGSLLYNGGEHQYTQTQMWTMVLKLVPALLWNKHRYGHFLDIFVSHAPPWGIHDQDDRAHQGIKAFSWLIKTFQPTYHLHGHVHVYSPATVTETTVGNTLILNTYGYQKITVTEQTKLHPISEQITTSH